jgi:DNA-binding Xre family transcriptional regulator
MSFEEQQKTLRELIKKKKKEKKTLRESMHISQRVLSNLQCTTATKPTGQETETSYHILLIEKTA